VGSGSGSYALFVNQSGISLDTLTLGNDTFVSTAGAGMSIAATGSESLAVNATDVIALGHASNGSDDVIGQTTTLSAHPALNLAYSDYRGQTTNGANTTVTPAGSGNNLTADPAFVNLAGGDLHLGPSSPLIDAGIPLASSGQVDLDGHPRVEGTTSDIGAYEFVVAPAVAGGTPTGLGFFGATLPGTVNPGHDTTHVVLSYGRSSALGKSVNLPDVAAGRAAVAVSHALTGLVPGATYFWQLSATTAAGSASTPILSFHTVSLPVPVISGLRVQPGHVANSGRHARVTASYRDSLAGKTTFTLYRQRGHHLVRVRSFSHSDKGGRVSLAFSTRGLKAGVYVLQGVPTSSLGASGPAVRGEFCVVAPGR
jgi:hypothetical protein